jgi:hypothetical protein
MKHAIVWCVALMICNGQIMQQVFLGGDGYKACCTFYVDPSGSDGASGTSPATAWQTVAHVNAQTFKPGQSVGFKSGGTWYELLQPPSSGIAGQPITFSSYGSGAPPIINGSNLETSWTSESEMINGYVSLASPGQYLSTPGTTSLNLTGTSFRIQQTVSNATYNAGSDQILIARDNCCSAGASSRHWEFHLSFGSLVMDLYDGVSFSPTSFSVPTAGLTNAAQYTLRADVIPTAATVSFYYSVDGITFIQLGTTQSASPIVVNAISDSVPVTVGERADGGAPLTANVFRSEIWTGLGTTVVLDMNSNLAASPTFVSPSSGPSATWTVSGSPAITPPSSVTIFYITWSEAQPTQVYYNSTLLTPVASKPLLAAGDWWFDAADSRIYIFDDPTGQVLLVSDPNRSYSGTFSGLSYLTFRGLAFEYANLDGLFVQQNSSNIILDGVTLSFNGNHGARPYAPSPYTQNFWTVLNVVATHNQLGGIEQNGYADRWLIQGSVFNYNVTAACSGSFCGGLRFISADSPSTQEATNVTVLTNTACYNGYGVLALAGQSTGSGFWLDTVSSGNSMSGNTACYNNDAGLLAEIGDTVLLTYNVSYGNSVAGIRLYNHMVNSGVYNNTLWGNGTYNLHFSGKNPSGDLGFNGNAAWNNIAFAAGKSFQAEFGADNTGSSSGNTYLYNSFYTPSSNFLGWGNLTFFSTYPSWEAATGNCGSIGCSHSLETDPQLINPPSNVNLQPGSPAIGAGIFIPGVSTANPPNMGAK